MTVRDDVRLFERTIEDVRRLDHKPTLFLHACCGPCLCYPYSILGDVFDVTVGYINPNIQPIEEYDRREKTLQSFLYRYSEDRGWTYSLVSVKEDFQAYDQYMKGREEDHEGGSSCLRCHALRIYLSYKYAYEHHYDYFTTVMTVSCKKPSKALNDIAEKMESLFPTTKYLFSDFKKKDGQLKGIKISRQYDLYRQDYCGCLFSKREREDCKKRKDQLPG